MPPYVNFFPCSTTGCTKARRKHGMCSMHWSRLTRTGDAMVSRRIIGDIEARFWSKVTKTDTCWLWTGFVSDTGYGIFSIGKRLMKAHHFLVGRPPVGREWHHQCAVRRCVRPSHLLLVTRLEHRREDGAPQADHFRARTHCPQGHPYDAVNTYLWRGERICRTCRRDRAARRRERKRLIRQSEAPHPPKALTSNPHRRG